MMPGPEYLAMEERENYSKLALTINHMYEV
jgi:hypothetical protein